MSKLGQYNHFHIARGKLCLWANNAALFCLQEGWFGSKIFKKIETDLKSDLLIQLGSGFITGCKDFFSVRMVTSEELLKRMDKIEDLINIENAESCNISGI